MLHHSVLLSPGDIGRIVGDRSAPPSMNADSELLPRRGRNTILLRDGVGRVAALASRASRSQVPGAIPASLLTVSPCRRCWNRCAPPADAPATASPAAPSDPTPTLSACPSQPSFIERCDDQLNPPSRRSSGSVWIAGTL